MPQTQYPKWEHFYRDAMLELDLKKLARRIDNAEAALLLRKKALERGLDGIAEGIAIEHASSALKFLRHKLAP
jgi:mannitol/fructose-specific phosphotransferase system IIA component (Ntr-type)